MGRRFRLVWSGVRSDVIMFGLNPVEPAPVYLVVGSYEVYCPDCETPYLTESCAGVYLNLTSASARVRDLDSSSGRHRIIPIDVDLAAVKDLSVIVCFRLESFLCSNCNSSLVANRYERCFSDPDEMGGFSSDDYFFINCVTLQN